MRPDCTCEWAARGIKGAHHSTECPVVRNVVVCPQCAERVPEETVWILRGKFYCSEGCARLAQGIK